MKMEMLLENNVFSYELNLNMKKLIYVGFIFLLLACNSEDAGDCFQTTGDIIQEEVTIEAFDKIIVNRDVQLILKDGPEYKVIIETGKNLFNDVEVKVVSNQLRLTDNNNCNYVRHYNITKIYVTAPNVREIQSSTQYDISSDGILNYDSLSLISENFNNEGTFTIGDFRLEINTTNFSVITNGLSSSYISGNAENVNVSFFAGAGRFDGRNLIAQNVEVYHRGSNDMIVNPQESLTGELLGAGDLISVNQPTVINVEQIYTGQLIFED